LKEFLIDGRWRAADKKTIPLGYRGIIDIFRKILIYKTTICCGCPTKRKIYIFTRNQKITQVQIN
jgi:hypothetical protein